MLRLAVLLCSLACASVADAALLSSVAVAQGCRARVGDSAAWETATVRRGLGAALRADSAMSGNLQARFEAGEIDAGALRPWLAPIADARSTWRPTPIIDRGDASPQSPTAPTPKRPEAAGLALLACGLVGFVRR